MFLYENWKIDAKVLPCVLHHTCLPRVRQIGMDGLRRPSFGIDGVHIDESSPVPEGSAQKISASRVRDFH
jgi:hypothetical protein